FEGISEGDTLTLQREPENRFDENAILVLDGNKRKLGYVPERDNVVFTRLMDAGKYLIAKVNSVDFHGSFRVINIGIYLVDF
nr:HIRAN domain-containing protein [Lachnospiraceae bacterium]